MKNRFSFHFILLCLVLVLSMGCGTFQVGVERTSVPDSSVPATIQALSTANAHLVEINAQTQYTPTAAGPSMTPFSPSTQSPTPAPARFSNLHFALFPSAAASQSVYVAGTPRVYAVWDYVNMAPGMTVTRSWTLNGQDWISKEVTWDAKYGANGTVTDVSVFDDEFGLQPGEYNLSISIIGQPPQNGFGMASGRFWVVEPDIKYPVPSLDKARTAIVELGGRLSIEEPDGQIRELVSVPEISGLAWFPDGRHLIYVERDRSRQQYPDNDSQVTHKMWVLDVDTGSQHLIGASGENFSNPVISPDGKHVAVQSGNHQSQGCNRSPQLAVLSLDEDYYRISIQVIENFNGLTEPALPSGSISINSDLPGRWLTDSVLQVDLAWSCLPSGRANPDGTYKLDLETMQAVRIKGD